MYFDTHWTMQAGVLKIFAWLISGNNCFFGRIERIGFVTWLGIDYN